MQAERAWLRTGKPPLGRPEGGSWLRCRRGPQVNLLEYHLDKIEELQVEIREARKEALRSGVAPSW